MSYLDLCLMLQMLIIIFIHGFITSIIEFTLIDFLAQLHTRLFTKSPKVFLKQTQHINLYAQLHKLKSFKILLVQFQNKQLEYLKMYICISCRNIKMFVIPVFSNIIKIFLQTSVQLPNLMKICQSFGSHQSFLSEFCPLKIGCTLMEGIKERRKMKHLFAGSTCLTI